MREDEAIARVCKLIALASSPFEEEARTAAMHAVRLIREHGLVVSPKVAPRPSHWPPYDWSPPPARPQPPPPPPSPPPRETASNDVVVLRSKFGGRCRGCRADFSVGDFIAWRPGSGSTHVECRDYWDDHPAGSGGR